jgi:hypothetical protein
MIQASIQGSHGMYDETGEFVKSGKYVGRGTIGREDRGKLLRICYY